MFGNNEKMKQFERIRTLTIIYIIMYKNKQIIYEMLKLNLNPKLNYHNQRVRKNHSLISLKIIEYNSNKFS